MGAAVPIDISGALKISSLTNGVININTNSGTQGFDVSGYTGTLSVLLTCGPGVSGTVIVPSLKAGADTNVSNANNWVANIANFSTTTANSVTNVDLRSSAFGGAGATGVINKYLYLTWLITGNAAANSGLDAWIIGQQKVSG